MNLTWDDEVTLISTNYTEDEIGQQTSIETQINVCCCRQSVSRQEFYLAGQNDIEVNEILIVHPYEYSGENIVVFNGKRLRVIKTYQRALEELELTCTEKMGDRHR